jgi:hypothetical protein
LVNFLKLWVQSHSFKLTLKVTWTLIIVRYDILRFKLYSMLVLRLEIFSMFLRLKFICFFQTLKNQQSDEPQSDETVVSIQFCFSTFIQHFVPKFTQSYHFYSIVKQKEWDTEVDESKLYFSPKYNNVFFSSAIDGWGFG